ncbi:MAG: ATP-binding protein [Butyricicoccus sp.]|nr:ATP-binding protein [Butyricicoccus sp.]
MLVSFSVENFMSFKEYQVFSMIAGKQTRHGSHILEVKGKRLLKGSFFFGANAAGKSNLFSAIKFARNIVVNGLRKSILTNKHFRIDKEYVNKPGVFQFDLFSNGHFYSYGFAISYINAVVEEEWLYQCDSTDIRIFERSFENGKTTVETDIHFSDQESRQRFDIFSENVPDDKLFLSEIAERKLTEQDDFAAYKDVRSWIGRLIVLTPKSRLADKSKLFLVSERAEDLGELLQDFDTGIESIALKKEKMENVLDFLPEEVKQALIRDIEQSFNDMDTEQKVKELDVGIAGRSFRFKKEDNQIFASQLLMNHGNDDDPFQLADESDGTQRLFDLIPIFQAGKQPRVIFIDELDRSFHTKLVEKFIRQFYQTTLATESQLIASVHDSNVMDLALLRQDEIWFVEREPDHGSKIYSLNRFKTRFDKKVAKDYLLGRYGAIPCFSQLDELKMGEE